MATVTDSTATRQVIDQCVDRIRRDDRSDRTVTISATDAVRKLAREAMSIQDACNGCGLAHRFGVVMSELMAIYHSTSTVNQHPITKLWLDKFQSLARIPQDFEDSGKTYDLVGYLIEGKDIEIEIV